MVDPDRLLTAALVLLSVLLLGFAGLAVAVIVGERIAMREYGDQQPGGGYGTIVGVFLLIVLLVPLLSAVIGWALRRSRPRSAAVATGSGGAVLALPVLAVGGGSAGPLLGVPGLVVVGLAVAAVVLGPGPQVGPR